MKKRNLSKIKHELMQAVNKAGFDMDSKDLHLEKTKALNHGHFSSNVAMFLAGRMGKRPVDVANAILNEIKSEHFEKIEIAGPGFINLRIEQKFYTMEARALVDNFDEYIEESLEPEKEKTMIIDYSHPNIAKPMGAHHLLTTVIGDAIKKTYKRAGWKVIADNFIGDMGTQFGKLMHAINKWGDIEKIERDPINELQKLYVKFHIAAEDDESLDDAGRAEYKKFEDGDSGAREMWAKIKKWSELEIQQIYDRLDVEFDYRNGESFYEEKMTPILEEGRRKGIIVDGNNGSWIIKPDAPDDTPVLVRKSDGATLYATRDLARIDYWEKTWSPDLMLNVVDVSQSFYFQQLFFAQSKLGLTSARNVHVSFGRMKFKDMKMSTRKGNVLLLDRVLDEAEERALVLVKEKAVDLSNSEQINLAKLMGINSVKYNILHQNRNTNITFDWDRMLSFDGNSAPYLMYSVARANSVLRKAEVKLHDCRKFDLVLKQDIEKKLLIQLMMYPDVIRRTIDEFKPNHIANYMYELAQDFNSFYNGNPIIKAETSELRKSRLLITAAVIKVLRDGFGLLGLSVPEKM